MHRHIERSPQADQDLLDLYEYIHADNPDAAERFLDTAWEMFLKLAELPDLGRVWRSANPALTGVRVIHLSDPFDKYLIFYTASNAGVRILTVIHGARDLSSLFG